MARYDHVAAPIRKRGGRHRYWFLAWDGHCAIAAPTAHGVVAANGPKNDEVLDRWDCEKHRFSIAELDPVECGTGLGRLPQTRRPAGSDTEVEEGVRATRTPCRSRHPRAKVAVDHRGREALMPHPPCYLVQTHPAWPGATRTYAAAYAGVPIPVRGHAPFAAASSGPGPAPDTAGR